MGFVFPNTSMWAYPQFIMMDQDDTRKIIGLLDTGTSHHMMPYLNDIIPEMLKELLKHSLSYQQHNNRGNTQRHSETYTHRC